MSSKWPAFDGQPNSLSQQFEWLKQAELNLYDRNIEVLNSGTASDIESDGFPDDGANSLEAGQIVGLVGSIHRLNQNGPILPQHFYLHPLYL